MMKIKTISKEVYEDFVSKSSLASFYQSLEWLEEKRKENKTCELVGLFDNETLVGVSLIIFLRVLRNKKMAYASRGFIYDYQDLPSFKAALKDYFKDVVFVKIDPPIILAKYDKDLNKTVVDNHELINKLKENGFKHFGFNMADEARQFRFVHRITLANSWEEQVSLMSKSTRHNMELATFKGVKIKEVTKEELPLVYSFFKQTLDRKKVQGFSLEFYQNILDSFLDKVTMYIVYIDKQTYLENLDLKIKEERKKLDDVLLKMQNSHVGDKLNKAKALALANIKKYEEERKKALLLDDITNIASMLTITKYNEVVSLSSGMDNNFREFCPKYVMYPEMIKKAFQDKLTYVNFLGVKNIFNKNDKDHGVYEVKRGFGGETIEYIGEFDLPIKPFLYKLYKLKNKLK